VKAEAVKFFRKHFEKRGRDVKAEAFKFLRKHFEKRSWEEKQPRKRLTLYRAGSGSKNYSTASTSLV